MNLLVLTEQILLIKVGKKQDSIATKMPDAPPGLFFRHAGHRYSTTCIMHMYFCFAMIMYGKTLLYTLIIILDYELSPLLYL